MTKPIRATHDDVLEAIAERLDISEAQFEEAESRYRAVGDWLNRDDSSLKHHDPQISPQGSFVLGTVIRPLNDRDEFDIDLVCELQATKKAFSQGSLKRAVGREVLDYADAHSMTSVPQEGRRHWTLHYAGEPKFHLDVLPALPDSLGFRKRLLEAGHVGLLDEMSLVGEALAITDNTLPTYEQITDDWPLSNPKGYAAWFLGKMVSQIQERKHMLVEQGLMASVDDVPDYRVKTPLQRSVQLLKRHRDWFFVRDDTFKPKSIAITTLAAHSYRDEWDLVVALLNILERMPDYIEQRDGALWIPNPVDPMENFARDWRDSRHPEAFYGWLNQAREDFRRYLDGGHGEVPDALKAALGGRVVENVLARLPVTTPTSVAPALVAGTLATDPAAQAARAVDEVRRRGSGSKPWAK